MTIPRTVAIFILGALATTAWAGDPAFIETAGQGGLAEVAAGKLASTKAATEDVRNFGMMMVRDHGAANEKLAALAKSEGVTMPDAYGKDHAAMLKTLEAADGASFDQAYMSHMVEAHEKTVQLMKSEITTGQDPEVRAFAESALPIVEKHLREARRITGRE